MSLEYPTTKQEMALALKELFPTAPEMVVSDVIENCKSFDEAIEAMSNLPEPDTSLTNGTLTKNLPVLPSAPPIEISHQAFKQLKDIFPEVDDSCIIDVLIKTNSDIEKSTEQILEQNQNQDSKIDQNLQPMLHPIPQLDPNFLSQQDMDDMNNLFDVFLQDSNFQDPENHFQTKNQNHFIPVLDQFNGVALDDYLKRVGIEEEKSIQFATKLIKLDQEFEERRIKREAEDLQYALKLHQEFQFSGRLSSDEEYAKKIQNEFQSEEVARKLQNTLNEEYSKQLEMEKQSLEYAKKLQAEFESEKKKNQEPQKDRKLLTSSEEHPFSELDNQVFDTEQRTQLRNEIHQMIHNQLTKINLQSKLGRKVFIEKVMTENLARRFEDKFLALKLKYNFSEEFTKIELAFHGTPAKNVNSILEKGLLVPETGLGKAHKVRHTTDNGWYGKGIYLSPDPAYCSGYARNSGKLLVCAVLMGKRYVCKNNQEYNGKPCKHGYDSHSSPDNLEYVLFSANQVYPCFVLQFK